MTTIKTRSKSAIWLIGFEEDKLNGSKLPSNRQVLSVFFYRHNSLKETIRDSSRDVIREAVQFWDKARIPIQPEHRAILKLEKLYEKWVKLKKNAKRQTNTQKEKETEFVDDLDNLFDMAHMNALNLIKIKEDREFLVSQRENGRRGCMGPVDMALASKESRTAKRRKASLDRKHRETQHLEKINEQAVLESSSSASEDESNPCDKEEGSSSGLVPKTRHRKRAKTNIFTPSLTAALDRTKLSDRNATYVLAAAAHSLGHNVKDLNINRSSVHGERERYREEIGKNLKNQFKATPTSSLVVHWDGKLLQDLTGKELVDRLPVILSGLGVSQLLGVPKLYGGGTGEAQATAVAQLLQEWGVVDRVSAMCFDTTASNTGRRNGACVLLEQKLEKDLLHLACRHHILELVLACVFSECVSGSCGPNVAIFKRFQQFWTSVDKESNETGHDHEEVAKCIKEDKDEIIGFATSQLERNQPRDDYREFLELVIIFLGGIPPRGVKFMAPGAVHHARWMAKAVYTLKIWMLRGQFKLNKREEQGLRAICIFVSGVYVKAWFTAPLAVSAPNSNLCFVQRLVRYKSENPAISNVASNKFAGHLWYVSDELVSMAFFDSELSTETKRAMVKALNERPGQDDFPKRIQLNAQISSTMAIEDFVTKNSRLFFQRLGISSDFLDSDPQTWELRDDYKAALETTCISQRKVVNDSAERGAALIEECNSIFTRKENQKQYLLQVVQDHRRKFPDCKKELLMKL